MPLSLRGRDEKALQSRRRTNQRATSKDARAEAPQCAKGRSTFQSVASWRRDGGREAYPRADEALEQQTATGEVLKIISRSELICSRARQLVKLAARLCEADLVAIHLPREGAMHVLPPISVCSQEWEELIKRAPIVPGRGTATGRVAACRQGGPNCRRRSRSGIHFTERSESGRISHRSRSPARARG